MRTACLARPGGLLWAAAVACCLQAAVTATADAPLKSAEADDNLQTEGDVPKRDWNNNLKMWGKRGWNNLHGGWGLKRSIPAWPEQTSYSPTLSEKRAWQSLQGGWGKRLAPSEEDLAMQELASMFEEENQDQQNGVQYEPETEYDVHEYEKRNWNKFSDGWGKRNKWEKFRGAWGKREPAWSNLKGIWGKRNI